ncbi:MAG TPA: nucleoside-diphosphate sugar epimerase/dehydratase [Candidatus Acidoferrum sp.]|nr:nucleoside-diphosphate sugar epimerase/dehydratase [Candidatus Acidoferrum sp.]
MNSPISSFDADQDVAQADAVAERLTTSDRFFARLRKNQARMAITGADLVLAMISYWVAVNLFRDIRGEVWTREVLSGTLGILLACRLAGLLSAGLPGTSLRYPSSSDVLRVIRGVSIGSVLFLLVSRIAHFRHEIPAALFVLDAAILVSLWGLLHCGVRLLGSLRAAFRTKGKRVLIVGAGDAGMSLAKELTSDPGAPCIPVALVDDDKTRTGRNVYGVPIAGAIDDLAAVASQSHAEEVLICIPSATRPEMSRILSACRQADLPVRTLPTLTELIDGRVSQNELRTPNISDLLNREEMHQDAGEIAKIVRGKTVLVTGAGGSIGSELSRQIASGSPSKLLLLDKSENSLFYIHRALRERYPDLLLRPLLIDLTCRDFVDEFMHEEKPEAVFHAAAHKHVGLIELHPHEGIRNNVLGIRNVALAALRCGAALFVNISSDKAVNPRNFMGCSKRITEMFIQDLSRSNVTRFMNVRFGNVAGSTGSVLRLFWEQIQKGGPLLVTDPRASRYFMTIPEAVFLILQAARLGHGGETFVFEMGEPINIYELAKNISLLAGMKPGKEVPIHFVGLQKGEKVAEELWEEWENPVPTEQAGIQKVSEPDPEAVGMLEKIQRIERLITRNDRESLRQYLSILVPQFEKNRQEMFLEDEPLPIFVETQPGVQP